MTLWARIGLGSDERKNEQRLLVTVEMRLKPLGTHGDDLGKSVDYADVVSRMLPLAATEHRTIECFAEEIAAMVLREKNIESVAVSIKKFALPKARSVMITIKRPLPTMHAS